MTSSEWAQSLGLKQPVFCGAMYPCSNPELVAEVSRCGAMGIIQPLSLVYVHGKKFDQGLKWILENANGNPVGMNVIVEKSSKVYEDRMRIWVDQALAQGVRFFITALGNPRWVVDKVHAVGGLVYHDVTEAKWAQLAIDQDVDGLICVNNQAGGHAGGRDPQELFQSMAKFGKPLVAAGGASTAQDVKKLLDLGYVGVQMGTRFIATKECSAHADYKNAIVNATAADIVLTDKISGVPVSVIRTPYIEKIGVKASGLAKFLLRGRKTKHWMRLFYTLQSLVSLKKASLQGASYKDYWQAGKSVAGIQSIQSVSEVLESLKLTQRA